MATSGSVFFGSGPVTSDDVALGPIVNPTAPWSVAGYELHRLGRPAPWSVAGYELHRPGRPAPGPAQLGSSAWTIASWETPA
ncbi:MAG: hypothetical protein JJE50_07645 [Actinomycetales bacterium]|nr:hypothetical protein [Actinomycetales bacterium]